jgi:hypothetical protein
LENCKHHYQNRSCIEWQVAFIMETIADGDGDLEEPAHAKERTPFPRKIRSRQGTILDWEVAATAGFVVGLARSYGTAGIPLGTIIAGYLRCVKDSRCNAVQTEQHERYICALIDSLYVQKVVRSTGILHGDLTSINIAENEGAGHVDTLWDNKIGLMDDTWLQWCYEEMSRAPAEASSCKLTAVTTRLCKRLRRQPQRYEKDHE